MTHFLIKLRIIMGKNNLNRIRIYFATYALTTYAYLLNIFYY